MFSVLENFPDSKNSYSTNYQDVISPKRET